MFSLVLYNYSQKLLSLFKITKQKKFYCNTFQGRFYYFVTLCARYILSLCKPFPYLSSVTLLMLCCHFSLLGICILE